MKNANICSYNESQLSAIALKNALSAISLNSHTILNKQSFQRENEHDPSRQIFA